MSHERIVSPRGSQSSGEWRGRRKSPYNATSPGTRGIAGKSCGMDAIEKRRIPPQGVGYARCSDVAHRRMRRNDISVAVVICRHPAANHIDRHVSLRLYLLKTIQIIMYYFCGFQNVS